MLWFMVLGVFLCEGEVGVELSEGVCLGLSLIQCKIVFSLLLALSWLLEFDCFLEIAHIVMFLGWRVLLSGPPPLLQVLFGFFDGRVNVVDN